MLIKMKLKDIVELNKPISRILTHEYTASLSNEILKIMNPAVIELRKYFEKVNLGMLEDEKENMLKSEVDVNKIDFNFIKDVKIPPIELEILLRSGIIK